jgi:hypothetical protein
MPVEKIKHVTLPDQHVDHVALRDHFGSVQLLTIHPFVVSGTGTEGFQFTPVDMEAAIEKEKRFMEARERQYLNHLAKHHPQHPRLLSHPEYAGVSQAAADLQAPAALQQEPKPCKECE